MTDNDVYDLLWSAAERLDDAASRAETTRQRTALKAAARDLRLIALGLLYAEQE